MPIKTKSGKWKWGNIERNSKKELVQTVYGIWKKNGSKGSFSDFWHGKHLNETSSEMDFSRIPEDSMLDIYDIRPYTGVDFKKYEYIGDCISEEGSTFEDASDMAQWINNLCEVIDIKRVKDRLVGAPKELVDAMHKLEHLNKLEDLDQIVCGIDAEARHSRFMMFIYLSENDIHYFFDCIDEIKESLNESSKDNFDLLLENPVKYDGTKDSDAFINVFYYSKEYKFAWKILWDRAKHRSTIHVFKPDLIKILGKIRYGWREYLVSQDHKTLKELNFVDFETKDEAFRKFVEMIN